MTLLYSDPSQSKRLPALVLAEAGRGDLLLCQITSKRYDDLYALSLKEPYFHSGGIKRDSCIRAGKLFTANEVLILGVAGHPVADAFPPHPQLGDGAEVLAVRDDPQGAVMV